MKGKGSGWHGESRRHSMARRGISTAQGCRKASGKRQRYLKNSRGKRVFTGDASLKTLRYILDNENPVDYSIPFDIRKREFLYPKYVDYSGYHQEGEDDGIWVAWDNSFGELAVEEFDSKEKASLFATKLDLTLSEVLSTQKGEVNIKMWKGLLDNVWNLPKGWDYEVIDLDTDDFKDLEIKEKMLKTAVPQNKVRIVIKGGVVWDVNNLPKGYSYTEFHEDR